MTLPNWLRRILTFFASLLVGVLVGVFVAWLIFRPERWPPAFDGTGDRTKPCGEFSLFDSDVYDTYSENGIDVKLGFDFNPGAPGCESSCGSIGFIQIVRTLDLDTPKLFYYPSIQKKQRATRDGWYIDRGEGYEWVYFGRKNGDTETFESYVTPGTVSKLATLSDHPYRPENHPYLGIRWQAVTVPVCIDVGSDQHGYYAWSWTVTHEGLVKDIKTIVANDSLVSDVRQALSKWNEQSEAWGTKKHPPEEITMR